MKIYEVDGYTGARLHKKPEAVYFIEPDGNWASSEVRRITVQFNDYIQWDDIPSLHGTYGRTGIRR